MNSNDDYVALISQIFQYPEFLMKFNIFKNSNKPFVSQQQISYERMESTTLDMSFFDCLETGLSFKQHYLYRNTFNFFYVLYEYCLVAPNGNIRGCMEETFHHVIVSFCIVQNESKLRVLFLLLYF